MFVSHRRHSEPGAQGGETDARRLLDNLEKSTNSRKEGAQFFLTIKMSNMDENNRSIDETKSLAETEALSKAAKHMGDERKYEEESDVSSTRASSNTVDETSSVNRMKEKGDDSSAASASSNPPKAEEIAALLQSSPKACVHQMAATFLEFGVGGEELMTLLQSKTKWLPVSLIVEHILPLLDRVSWNRLCSSYKELYAARRKVTNPPWPFKGRLHAGGHGNVYSVAFLLDSELLTSGGSDRIIRIWDRTDGRCTHLEGHTNDVNDLHFSPDGKLLVSASRDRTIRLWKLEDRSSRVLEGHGSSVSSVAFSRDGSTLLSGDCAGVIRLWDLNDNRCIRELVDETIGMITSVTFAPDGKTIASAGDLEEEDGTHHGAIVLWDISDADDISSTTAVDTHDGTIYSLQYSPDGRYFASGAENGTIRLWNAADNSCTILMTGSGDTVSSVAFSPNGKFLASASGFCSVRLWRVEDGDGSCLVNLSEHHVDFAYSVAFSPDGLTLASCGRDGTVCLWNPHEEDRKQFKQVDWETVFRLWNFGKE